MSTMDAIVTARGSDASRSDFVSVILIYFNVLYIFFIIIVSAQVNIALVACADEKLLQYYDALVKRLT